MWDVWKNLFLECVEKHALLRTKRVRASNSPWITPQLKKRLHERDILKLKAIVQEMLTFGVNSRKFVTLQIMKLNLLKKFTLKMR